MVTEENGETVTNSKDQDANNRPAPMQKAELPVEIVEQICLLAAQMDRRTAYALAFVSKSICRLTAKARWRTIAITSPFQYLPFWRELHGVPDQLYEVIIALLSDVDSTYWALSHQEDQPGSSSTSNAKNKLVLDYLQSTSLCGDEEGRLDGISFPESGLLEGHIRHLLIDFDVSAEDEHSSLDDPSLASLQYLRGLVDGALKMLKRPEQYDMKNWLDLISATDALLTDAIFGLDTTGSAWSLEHLSLGREFLDYWGLDEEQHVPVEELSLVLTDGDGAASGRLLTIFEGVNKVYMLGVDPKSELSGLAPPRDVLTFMLGSREWTNLSQIRYDTRKFSFKPAEIFASRLRPLLLEAALVGQRSEGEPSVASSSPQESSYKHEGPRHAAPQRGAGRSLNTRQQKVASLTPVQHFKKDPAAKWLKKAGVGKLDLLQFAWQPMDDGDVQARNLPMHRRARYSATEEGGVGGGEGEGRAPMRNSSSSSNDTGGWPREMRGAWTERSDRDTQPSFEAELRDAIASLYGWQAPGVEPALKFAARKNDPRGGESAATSKNVAFSPEGSGEWIDRVKEGVSVEERENLADLRVGLVQHLGPSVTIPELQYGVRAPQSLLHLGGRVPYRARERLALFEDRARGGKGVWP